jgi:hypothetical protein
MTSMTKSYFRSWIVVAAGKRGLSFETICCAKPKSNPGIQTMPLTHTREINLFHTVCREGLGPAMVAPWFDTIYFITIVASLQRGHWRLPTLGLYLAYQFLLIAVP